MKQSVMVSALLVMVMGSLVCLGQQQRKPVGVHKPVPHFMTNADVIQMARAGLAESTIVTTIQTRKSKFDVSPKGLITLHRAGVTQAEMDAMIAVSGGGAPAATPPPAATVEVPATYTPSPSRGHLPSVTVIQNGAPQELPLEKTQLAQTKTKPTSMKSLAADSVAVQAMTAEVGTVTNVAAAHMNSSLGSSTMQQSASIFSGIMAHRKPSMTFVWGISNPTSTNVLQTSTPSFVVNYSNVGGVNIDEYEPIIVKLTPAQNSCRIVGATEGKEDASSNPAADWQIYSSFLEERVAVKTKKTAKGQYHLAPASSLLPGEYAIVLRPVSKSKKFSGADVARSQGDGMMFDSAWSFQVPPESD